MHSETQRLPQNARSLTRPRQGESSHLIAGETKASFTAGETEAERVSDLVKVTQAELGIEARSPPHSQPCAQPPTLPPPPLHLHSLQHCPAPCNAADVHVARAPSPGTRGHAPENSHWGWAPRKDAPCITEM